MPCCRTRPALALLATLLCLAACTPTTIGNMSPTATATVPPAPMATPTPVTRIARLDAQAPAHDAVFDVHTAIRRASLPITV